MELTVDLMVALFADTAELSHSALAVTAVCESSQTQLKTPDRVLTIRRCLPNEVEHM